MFLYSRQVLDIALTKVHNTFRSLKTGTKVVLHIVHWKGFDIQDVVC